MTVIPAIFCRSNVLNLELYVICDLSSLAQFLAYMRPCSLQGVTPVNLQAERELEALEAKRQQSRIELEAALREKKALEEAEKRRKQRAAAERDQQAKRAEEHLKQLQAAWAENKNLAEVTFAGMHQSLLVRCEPCQQCSCYLT